MFALGVNYWDTPFNGLIDEVKVYEASLSGAEIKALDIDHLSPQFTTAFFGWASDTSWISLVPRGPGGAQNTMLWSGTQWFDGTFNSQIPVGAWSHVVAVVNKGTLNVYLNFWDVPYNGLMDELKIYDEALAAENVRELYAEGSVPHP